MSSRFSGAVQLTDLDDFITPSQECIKPVIIEKGPSTGLVKIKVREEGYYEEKTGGKIQKLEKVKVTLNDCLACSGCITSAEEVLVTQQNCTEVLKNLRENKKLKENGSGKLVVVSLSIQPVLSLAAKYKMTPEKTAECLATLLKSLGADKVIEMSLAEDLALCESQLEFVERYRNKEGNNKPLPMLASSCPGWICYAEKTHGSFILPYISTTKSPQQIIGSMVKYNLGFSPDRVYHVTLMPCYDKKLEASRNEFFNSELNSKDVDCVITTIELEQLMTEENIIFDTLKPTPLDYPWGKALDQSVRGHPGSGSGGYAHHILTYAAQELFGMNLTDMPWKAVRNPDLMELIVEKDDKQILRFAIANGFRNIQNVVQKIKRGKRVYDYVEIMACPSGCLNGGAQIKAEDIVHAREGVTALEELYKTLPATGAPERTPPVERLYMEWLGGVGSDKCVALLHTSYRRLEKPNTALNIKW